jgi:hypothetical protein
MGSNVRLSFSHEHFPVCNVASSFFFMGVLFNLYWTTPESTVNKKFQVSSLQGEQGYTGGLRNHRKDAWYSGIAC